MLIKTITQRDATIEARDNFQQILTREIGLFGTDTGFHTLNMITGGHVPTNITTFASRPGQGKTGLVVQMAEAAGRQLNGRRSELLVASWEMKASKLIDRYVSHETGFTLMQLKYPKVLSNEQRNSIEQAFIKASKFPVHYHQYSTNIDVVRNMLVEFANNCKKKEQIEGIRIQPVFLLDYIGRLQARNARQNKTYEISDFMYGLKEVCNQTGMCALVLSQINRGADNKDFPELTDISDSQSIEQASDNLIIGHRPEYYGKETLVDPMTGSEIPSRNKMLWRIVKCREGEPRDVIVNCDIKNFRLWDREHHHNYPYYKDYNNPEFWKEQFGLI